MQSPAFTSPLSLALKRRTPTLTSLTPRRRRHSNPAKLRMQLPPLDFEEPPLSPSERAPEGYVWNPDYPGTLKPGSEQDNFPLEKVLASGVYDRMVYEEIDMDDCTPQVYPLAVDMLHWLAEQGRLLPREMTDDEFDTETEKQISGITEEDLEFADDDSKMIAYYSKQGEGTATGAGPDFGGFSESSADVKTGF